MTKIILGAILAAVAVISMTAVPAMALSPLPYLQIVSSSVSDSPASVSITTAAPVASGIPSAYGYGVITSNGVLAVTTHKGVGPDSITQVTNQRPVFHTHFVTLASTGDCASGLKVASASFNEVGNLKISGDNISITNIDSSVGTLTNAVVSFTLTLENGNICVNPQ